jgi:hypothetical protein
MNKLIYQSETYSIELDITDAMKRAIKEHDVDVLDEQFEEMKTLIQKNTTGLNEPFKIPLPWFLRRFF